MRHSRTPCILTILSLLLLVAPQVSYGQSFLEKLEQTVKEQLGESTNQSTTGELPAPAEPPRANNSVQTPQPQTPAGSGLGLPSASAPPLNSQEKGTGRIYLGLEAEEPLGAGIGVRVAAVTEQSPAWKAGFKSGDKILAINGFAIANMESMVEQLSKTSPGQTVRFLVLRGGRNINLTAVLMDAGLAARIQGGPTSEDTAGPAYLGMIVNDLTSSFRNQFAISVFRGAAVTRVASGSPAQKAGIQAGDVVIEANGNPIEGARDLMKWMTTTRPGQRAEFLVYRGSSQRRIDLTLESDPDSRAAPKTAPAPIPAATPPIVTPRVETPVPTPTTTASSPDQKAPSNQPDSESSLAAENERLKNENSRLRDELRAAQKRLDDAQQRLNQVLDALKGSDK